MNKIILTLAFLCCFSFVQGAFAANVQGTFAAKEKVYYTISMAKTLCYDKGLKEEKEIKACIQETMKNNYHPPRKPAKK